MASELLGAEKHLEICAACNHGRTPCDEYRRNYERAGHFKVPFTKALTVFLTKDSVVAQLQADTDIKSVEDGSQVFVHPTNEAYFHRLRRRVAEKPELVSKIAVFFQNESGQVCEVGLNFDDELRWPPGFYQELWDEEVEISKIRYARMIPPRKFPKSFKEIRELFAQKHPVESLFFEHWLKESGEL